MAESHFNGFTEETLKFFADLVENNNQTWFKANKPIYDAEVIIPAKAFVQDLGKALLAFAPGVVADTRTNGAGSIFRIYRDTRFSPDKTPYKNHLGIFLWEGPNKKMENPGFYLHVEDGILMLGTGMYMFGKDHLARYREAVADEKAGPAMLKAVEAVTQAGPYSLGGAHYKRVPRGYEKDHPMAEWLKFNGLYVMFESDIPPSFFSRDFIEFCAGHFKKMHALHPWLLKHVCA